MQIYFIDNDDYFMKREILTDKEGKVYDDNSERAIFYARGVLETVKKLGWCPDVIHCHGWISALAPFYIKQAYKDAHYSDIQDICENAYGHTELEKIGVKFSDGVIVESKDVDSSIIEYAKSLGLPVLRPVAQDADSFKNEYSDFYETLF